MSEPAPLDDLVHFELENGDNLEDHRVDFDWEMAARYAVDTLMMAVRSNSKKEIIKQCGALGALGLELEDVKPLTDSDLNTVAQAFMLPG